MISFIYWIGENEAVVLLKCETKLILLLELNAQENRSKI